MLDYPDMGSVLRCNLDGSDLEMLPTDSAGGAAFDDHGNHTGDNNCDYGDAPTGYVGGRRRQRSVLPINSVKQARMEFGKNVASQFPGQAAYIVPPIAPHCR